MVCGDSGCVQCQCPNVEAGAVEKVPRGLGMGLDWTWTMPAQAEWYESNGVRRQSRLAIGNERRGLRV